MRSKTRRKPTAAENKLNALLGLTEKVEEVRANTSGSFYGVSEDEIDKFRAAQGLIYFLAAPKLFHPKVCRHCKEPFIVSRQFVACCSYTCIRKDLEERGFKWSKGDDLEALAQYHEVYNGNEPIWVKQPQLSQALEVLKILLEKENPKDEKLESPPPQPVTQEPPTTSTEHTSVTPTEPSSVASTMTTLSKSSEPGTTLSRKKKPSRRITFGS